MSDTVSRWRSGPRPNTWQLIVVDELGDHPRYSAIVFCPDCGRALSLVNHTIAADGQVSPSIGHPESYRNADGSLCGWHPTPRLLDWPGDAPVLSPIPKSICERCGTTSRSVGGWGAWSGGQRIICASCITAHNLSLGASR